MASTSRSNSTRNVSSNVTLYEPQKHFTPTPHMTRMKFLQLHKLSDLSNCVRGKLHLSKIFLPNAKDILPNELSQYAKDKLLEIITSICHVDNGIETIGKDERLVKVIFCSFGNCTRNVRLQRTLFKFFSLVLCEIQCNDESTWIRHLVNSYKYNFGPHILRILTEYFLDWELVTEIMTFLDILSDLTLPDGTNEYVLEHVFKVDDLVSALLKWFFSVFIYNYSKFLEINYFWLFVDKWIKIMTVVTKFRVRSRLYDSDNDAKCAVIHFAISTVHRVFRNSLVIDAVFAQPVLHDNSLLLVSPPCVETIHRIRRLLSNLPRCDLFLRSTGNVLFILHMVPSFYQTEGNDQAGEERLDLCKVGRKFQVVFSPAQQLHDVLYTTREWSFKDILEVVLLWKHTSPFLTSSTLIMLRSMFLSNVPNTLQQKIHYLGTYGIELPYSLY